MKRKTTHLDARTAKPRALAYLSTDAPANIDCMKIVTWILLIFGAVLSSAHARIGHTREQCIERYGEPISVDANSNSATFHKAGFRIEVYFFEGRCEWLTLAKFAEKSEQTFQSINDVEIETFISANGEDRDWEEIESTQDARSAWRTEDDSLRAVYISAPQWKLSVYTAAALRRRSFQSEKK